MEKQRGDKRVDIQGFDHSMSFGAGMAQFIEAGSHEVGCLVFRQELNRDAELPTWARATVAGFVLLTLSFGMPRDR